MPTGARYKDFLDSLSMNTVEMYSLASSFCTFLTGLLLTFETTSDERKVGDCCIFCLLIRKCVGVYVRVCVSDVGASVCDMYCLLLSILVFALVVTLFEYFSF